MKSKIFTIFLSGIFTLSLTAQEVAFKTLANKGQNAVERGSNPGNFEPLKMGTPIYKNDKIVVGANSYLGLASTAGKTVEIKSEGVYNVTDLSGNLTADNSSITSKYIAYVFSDLAKGSASNYASNLSLTGSVERSIGNNGINIFLPQSCTILKNGLTRILWKPELEVKEYQVSILNLFDEEVFTKVTTDEFLAINFEEMNLQQGEVYKLQVSDNANKKVKSGVVTLEIADDEKANQINSEFAAISEMANEENAISNLIKASFYEQNGMYLEAMDYFEKAISAEPNVEEYKILFDNFKFRSGISGELEE